MSENDEHVSSHNIKGDPTRILALTDGVFAIIMTILVLELKVPLANSNEELHLQLGNLLFKLLLYAVSFLLASVYWIGHRNLFNLIKKVNVTLIWINIGFLMLASLIPFAATLLGAYSNFPLALQAYGSLLFALASYRLFMYVYVCNHHEILHAPVQKDVYRKIVMVMCAAPVLFFISILCSPDWPRVAITIYAVTPAIFVTLITTVSHSKGK